MLSSVDGRKIEFQISIFIQHNFQRRRRWRKFKTAPEESPSLNYVVNLIAREEDFLFLIKSPEKAKNYVLKALSTTQKKEEVHSAC